MNKNVLLFGITESSDYVKCIVIILTMANFRFQFVTVPA